MHYLIALIYFVLALIGVDGYGSHTLLMRSVVNGADVLYSKTTTIADVADITCVRSTSGSCHYRLLAPDCRGPRPRPAATLVCANRSVQQFSLVTGASREIVGLPVRFTLCVSQADDPAHTECETLPALDRLAWWR